MAPRDPEGLRGCSPPRLNVGATGLAKTAAQAVRAHMMTRMLMERTAFLGDTPHQQVKSRSSVSGSRGEAVWYIPYRIVLSNTTAIN